MAKDGTARGGARAGSGRKSKALAEKIEGGNPGGRKLTALKKTVAADCAENAGIDGSTDIIGALDMPEYMTEMQKDKSEIEAREVYNETVAWLRKWGCEELVNVQLVRSYAMSVARWIQCERAISKLGFLAKHPTTGQVIASPYVTMAQNYMKQVNNLWYQIYQVVKENCTEQISGATPQDDAMERLLRTKGA